MMKAADKGVSAAKAIAARKGEAPNHKSRKKK